MKTTLFALGLALLLCGCASDNSSGDPANPSPTSSPTITTAADSIACSVWQTTTEEVENYRKSMSSGKPQYVDVIAGFAEKHAANLSDVASTAQTVGLQEAMERASTGWSMIQKAAAEPQPRGDDSPVDLRPGLEVYYQAMLDVEKICGTNPNLLPANP